MINLEQLVSAVQRSAMAASDALVAKNLDTLQQFFEPAEDDEASKITEATQRALSASRAASDAASGATSGAAESDSARAAVRQAAEALETAAAAMAKRRGSSGMLRPKMMAVQFPHVTKEGPGVHTVYVPLIALAPVSFARVSEVRFKTDLHLSAAGDELAVSFPSSGEASGGPPPASAAPDGGATPKGTPTSASIEIVVSETPLSQGLRLLVEGYERALRAQIPG
ncbi:DUF2589 domain-containing protein [Polyangium sorediatum]|uniref:DUF2589 domain-containing protein n=1 Tax=Polyangium sorediatum TaxID=889274 RepID=A0ABT6NNX7_9BACT|nr:DUF2589 domain-containing protein [Polyangium sorediatum]MDI1430028.1 DUF2589 domain-containing protein [Polyangium sorediatum]